MILETTLRVVAGGIVPLVLGGLVAALLVGASATSVSAADLKVERVLESNGNTTLTVLNRDAAPIAIRSMIVNHSSKPACELAPVASDYDTSFLRSDLFTNSARVTFPDQKAVSEVVLAFGETVDAVVHRSCGRVLYLEILTDAGMGWFEFSD